MPKAIIDEIGNVTYSVVSQNQSQNQSSQKTIPFSVVDLDPKYSEITIPLKFDFTNIRIIINGNAENTSLGLVDQASNLLNNDTNSSNLLNQLGEYVGNLINEFSNFFSR